MMVNYRRQSLAIVHIERSNSPSMVQKVMRHIVANVAKYTTNKKHTHNMNVPENNLVR